MGGRGEVRNNIRSSISEFCHLIFTACKPDFGLRCSYSSLEMRERASVRAERLAIEHAHEMLSPFRPQLKPCMQRSLLTGTPRALEEGCSQTIKGLLSLNLPAQLPEGRNHGRHLQPLVCHSDNPRPPGTSPASSLSTWRFSPPTLSASENWKPRTVAGNNQTIKTRCRSLSGLRRSPRFCVRASFVGVLREINNNN